MFCFIAVLEVYQFARDAAVAEAWLVAHEPYLNSRDYGVSLGFFFATAIIDLLQRLITVCTTGNH